MTTMMTNRAPGTGKAQGSAETKPGGLMPGKDSAPIWAALEDDMAYKGEDLDLRAPREPASARYTATGYGGTDGEGSVAPGIPRGRPRTNGYYQNGTQRSPALYVDETLLACCNHAYDIASANGAREVLLEHLVHALTRVPEAAQILENRGVHVMALRRESATIIANDLPISPTDSGTQAKASSDFDAVLHLAAANARLRSERPTSVRDILFVLMNYERQASGIDLLRRHWASWQQDDLGDEAPRVQRPPRDPRVAMSDPQPMSEPTDFWRPDRSLEARLESLVNSLHDSVTAQRSDNQNLRAVLGERLQRLERVIELGRGDNGTTALEMAITARLQRLEKMQESLLAHRVSLAPLEAAMNDRFHRLEKTIEANRFDQGKLPAGANDRIQGMERMLVERLQRLEKAIESVTHAMPSGLIDRMQAMETSFEAKISESMRMWGTIGERLQGMERSLTAHRAEVAHLQTSNAQVQNVLNERAQDMERAIASWRQESAAASSGIPGPLMERLGALETLLVAWNEDGGTGGGGDVPGVLFERLQSIERSISSIREDSARLAKTNEAAIADLRANVTQLSGVQRNVSEAIDQWRLDTTGDLGNISNRLEAIEHSNVRPMELLESLNARVQAMSQGQPFSQSPAQGQTYQTSTVLQPPRVRNGQRRGFWRWLFGLS